MNNTALTNMSLAGWFSEMEADEYNYNHQGQMNSSIFSSIVEFPQEIVAAEGVKHQSNPKSSTFGYERPSKQSKIQDPNCSSTKQAVMPNDSNPFEISFGGKPDLGRKSKVVSDKSISFLSLKSKGIYDNQFDVPSRDQDHVIAERKRREKLNQQFIDLAAIVPGLKKMDKASVLGDAVKHLKQLQERVKLLEEQISKKSEERVIYVNYSQLSSDHEDSSSWDENFDSHYSQTLPEIEAKISDKSVLIRIHCEKQKGVAAKVLSAIEKLHLTVVNSSFLPFGTYTVDITLIAEMDAEFSSTLEDLVKNLREACVN